MEEGYPDRRSRQGRAQNARQRTWSVILDDLADPGEEATMRSTVGTGDVPIDWQGTVTGFAPIQSGHSEKGVTKMGLGLEW